MSVIKKYKFSDKNHSPGGSVSVLMGAASVILLIICVVITTKNHGGAGEFIGGMGLLAAFLAAAGCVIGLLSFKEEEKYYLFSKIGSLLCGILCVFYLAVFLMGLGF